MPRKRFDDLRQQYDGLLQFLNETITPQNYLPLFLGAVRGEQYDRDVGVSLDRNYGFNYVSSLQHTLRILVRGQCNDAAQHVLIAPEHLVIIRVFELMSRTLPRLARCPAKPPRGEPCDRFFLARKGQATCGKPICKQRHSRTRKQPRQKVRDTEIAL